jgi:hypothetical protein
MDSHAFLTPLQLEYKECIHCGHRKVKVCLKCRYCYSCHPVSELLERRPQKTYFAIGNLPDIESQTLFDTPAAKAEIELKERG